MVASHCILYRQALVSKTFSVTNDSFTKRRARVQEKGGHYLVFQGKAISKIGHCHRRNYFIVYKNKMIFKKKVFNLGRGTAVGCP